MLPKPRHFLRRAAAALIAAAGLCGPVLAGPVVVELFTSQGCSSCPPADRFLAEHLADRDDVLALSLHVDYWDYIGWKDEFAHPAFTKRQKSYARNAGSRSIYTPQMVIDGQDHVVGFRPMQIADQIMHHVAAPDPVSVQLERAGASTRIHVAARADLPKGGAVIQFVRFAPEREVAIKRGENAGRTITYANIVTQWGNLGAWSGQEPFVTTVETKGPDAVAVIVQRVGTGPILGAGVAR